MTKKYDLDWNSFVSHQDEETLPPEVREKLREFTQISFNMLHEWADMCHTQMVKRGGADLPGGTGNVLLNALTRFAVYMQYAAAIHQGRETGVPTPGLLEELHQCQRHLLVYVANRSAAYLCKEKN